MGGNYEIIVIFCIIINACTDYFHLSNDVICDFLFRNTVAARFLDHAC